MTTPLLPPQMACQTVPSFIQTPSQLIMATPRMYPHYKQLVRTFFPSFSFQSYTFHVLDGFYFIFIFLLCIDPNEGPSVEAALSISPTQVQNEPRKSILGSKRPGAAKKGVSYLYTPTFVAYNLKLMFLTES